MTGLPQSGDAGMPHWTLNGSISYDQEPFSLTVEGRYIDSGLYDATLIGPHQEGYSNTLANSINDNTVPSRFYVNLAGSFDLWNDGNKKVQLYGTVNNLLDKDAPNAPPRTNAYLFDVLGRYYRIGVRAQF